MTAAAYNMTGFFIFSWLWLPNMPAFIVCLTLAAWAFLGLLLEQE